MDVVGERRAGYNAASNGACEERSMACDEKVSILVPVYNERYTIQHLIAKALAAPLPQGLSRELIVVDDCSTDGTERILKRLAREHGNSVHVYSHPKNMGKGAAIRTAVQHAAGDICIIQDADLEYDPRDYRRLLAPILEDDADVVYGSRFIFRERRRVLLFWHSVGNRILTALSNAFTNLNLTDMETGYKAIRTEILKSIPIRCNRFAFEPEITAKLAKRGCRFYEVPISYRGRTYQEGKKATWWDGLKAALTVLRFWLMDDLYNERYGHAILYGLSTTHRFTRWIAERIRPWVQASVLEIGAGLGNITCRFLPRDKYVVSDVDSLHVRFLRSRFAHHPYVEVRAVRVEESGDFVDLAAQFDTVLCVNVLEHVERDEQALGNMYRALKHGGRVVLLVPRGQWLYGTLDEVLGHCRRYSAAELHEKCLRAGFAIERTFTLNRVGVLAWFLNGKILRRRRFGKVQLKIFDMLMWLWRSVDAVLPWPGVSLVVVARK